MKDNAAPADLRHIDALLTIMAKLRDPDGGCPWDLEQTFRSVVPYTLEEAYEVADAIERNSLDDLKEELGDLLLQVVFHARIAEEQGAFDFADVVSGISEKMVRRHPHVFSDGKARTADDVSLTWEEIKQAEKVAKGRTTVGLLDDVPAVLPGLAQAVKLQKQAAKVGFDWPSVGPVLEKVEEELAELKIEVDANAPEAIEEEFGDLLFVLANYARHLKIDPDAALRRANRKFRSRFASMELNAKAGKVQLSDLTLEELEALWVLAKEEEKRL
ncbi:MAG: nucleoside triphosphate pyrophosphohydrolase [Rhodobiaceae bacterium]|nr:MAG: nucleoside triphosphate pyrophosphohydrolase [Rhodobiaceae bacterium]